MKKIFLILLCLSINVSLVNANIKNEEITNINYVANKTKVTIKEVFVGIDGLYGDALQEGIYELYSKDELLETITNKNYGYVSNNDSYILKDVSPSSGFYINDDIYFDVEEDDYEILITKYVIAKNLSIDIQNNNVYYVYLKSNEELYTMIDKDTNLITLPYGLYYVIGDNYYEEIEVYDSADDVWQIPSEVTDDEIIFEEEEIEDKDIAKANDSIEDTNKELEENIPTTNDSIILYIKLGVVTLSMIGICIGIKRYF